MNEIDSIKLMRTLLTLLPIVAMLISSANAEAPDPLVLYRIGDVPVKMQNGDKFGVMLVNDGGEEDPSPRYIVAIAETRTVVDTKDIEVFKSIVKRIAKGSTVFEYGSCTVPRSWGLKEEHFKAYDDVFKELGLQVSEEPRITCYCESVVK